MSRTSSLKERIATGILILDGAMGTQLMQRDVKGSNELWGFEHPEELMEIHRAYLEAGAQTATTNTFGGSRPKLSKAGLGERTVELNTGLAKVGRQAVGDDGWALGDIGPTGEFVEPYGTFSEDELVAVFVEQATALRDGGVDGFIIETMMDATEAACAVRAAKQVSPELPVLATLTFDRNAQGFRTMMGVSPAKAASALAEAGADAIGANCGGITIDQYVALLGEMRAEVDLPLIAQANAGLPEVVEGTTVFNEGPEKFSRSIPDLLAAGVSVIGGCCGTTPDHIRAVAAAVAASKG